MNATANTMADPLKMALSYFAQSVLADQLGDSEKSGKLAQKAKSAAYELGKKHSQDGIAPFVKIPELDTEFYRGFFAANDNKITFE